MKIIVVGGGRSLFFLCRNFIARGHDVVIVNPDRDECEELSRRLQATVLRGDGSDPTLLEEAGTRGANIVLAITARDEDNLVICQLAAARFGVHRTIALVNDPANVEVFEKLDVIAFSTTQVIGSLIEQRAAVEQIVNLLPVAGGRVLITEVILDNDSRAAGKYVRDLDLPEGALVAVVLRKNEPIIPRGVTQLHAYDRLLLITVPGNHDSVMNYFTGG